MRLTMTEILHNDGADRPQLGLDRATRDGLAAYARLRWPAGTAKAAARAWDLTLDEAKGLVAGRASQSTIDKIWKHPAGGWAVILPVLGAVVGHGFEDFLRTERTKHAELARRHGAVVRDLRALALPDHRRAGELGAADPGRRRTVGGRGG